MAALRSSSRSTVFVFSNSASASFDHADGTFNNTFARGDDGFGLLALQHGPRDFLCVGEVTQSRFHDFDAGLTCAFLNFLL